MLTATAIGAVVSLVTGSAPGALLGVLLMVGSVAAALGVHFRRAYLLIPVPAPAYVVAAIVIGLFHDRGADISRTALAVNAAQWVAGGFLWMTAATIAVIAITSARWLARRHEPDAAALRGQRDWQPGRTAARRRSGHSGYAGRRARS
jgi:hypothetical protein